MNVLVVGLGEIGNNILEVVKGKYNGLGLDIQPKEIKEKIDYMHVCYPYTSSFVEDTVRYIERFNPRLTMIESTVKPFTTTEVYEKTKKPVVHSPVKGNAKDGFKWGLFSYTKFVGPPEPRMGEEAAKYYQSLGFRTKVCNSPVETEFAKLLETTYYGVMIAWHQETNRICKKYGLSWDNVTKFAWLVTEEGGYRNHLLRPYFYPGFIGGHCVIPNAQILKSIYPSAFVDALLESNQRRKGEKDEWNP